MEAPTGPNACYLWKSIRESRVVLEKGLIWRVGNGKDIRALEDLRVPTDTPRSAMAYEGNVNASTMVSQFIDEERAMWDVEKETRSNLDVKNDVGHGSTSVSASTSQETRCNLDVKNDVAQGSTSVSASTSQETNQLLQGSSEIEIDNGTASTSASASGSPETKSNQDVKDVGQGSTSVSATHPQETNWLLLGTSEIEIDNSTGSPETNSSLAHHSLIDVLEGPATTGDFGSRVTGAIVICWAVVILSGFILGYDIGVLGLITIDKSFLWNNIHALSFEKLHFEENNFCKYNDQRVRLLISSSYLIALICGLISMALNSKWGRRSLLQIGSFSLLAGVVLNAASNNIFMLIGGRVVLGLGFGFCSQVIPLYILEFPDSVSQDSMFIFHSFANFLGTLVVNILGLLLKSHLGWAVLMGGLSVPALVLFIFSFCIDETPVSLILHGNLKKGKEVLRKIRGIGNVDSEFNKILVDFGPAKSLKSQYKYMVKRSSRPPLTIALLHLVFQQLGGPTVILFFGPVFFASVGFNGVLSKISAQIVLVSSAVGTLLSPYLISRFGRRNMLLGGCTLMFITELLIGVMLHSSEPSGFLKKKAAVGLIVLAIIYSINFALTSGPLDWSSTTFSPESQVMGSFLSTGFSMMLSFVISQGYLFAICWSHFWIFIVIAIFISLFWIVIYSLIPETANIPPDELVHKVWNKHWFWKRFMVEHVME
ncbi:sugar transport protein 8-like [Herrania umbratica]|uniref:Sugar transport protein 8-like n=1 Tax=Herrania umbratica TaxID=108875 RepID=A0A6J1BMG4_9ROSI|nr:sugar transport protein 8-like [Herrania umbratica]